MEVSSEVLALEMEKEFESYNFEVIDEDTLTVRNHVTPGTWHFYDEHKGFVKSIEEYLMMHTEDWEIDRESGNRIEGRHIAVLKSTA